MQHLEGTAFMKLDGLLVRVVSQPTVRVKLFGNGADATIYATNSIHASQVKSNPFTGNADGSWDCYVPDTRVNVELSGGTPVLGSTMVSSDNICWDPFTHFAFSNLNSGYVLVQNSAGVFAPVAVTSLGLEGFYVRLTGVSCGHPIISGSLEVRGTVLLGTSGGRVLIGTTADNGAKVSFGAGQANQKRIIGIYEAGSSFTGIGMDDADAGVRIAGDPSGDSARLLDIGYYSTDGLYTWTSRARILRSGNVLLGTVSDLFGGSQRGVVITNGAQQLLLGVDSVNAFGFLGPYSNHPLAFIANNAERMRITAGGNVLVGSSGDDGSTKLQVYGNLKVYNTSPILSVQAVNGGPTAMLTYLSMQDSGSAERGWVGFGNGNTAYSVHNNIGLVAVVASGGALSAALNPGSGFVLIGKTFVGNACGLTTSSAIITASKALGLADGGVTQVASTATNITFTLSANAGFAAPVGTVIPIYRAGAGTVTVTSGGTVTILGKQFTVNSLSGASLEKIATDTWLFRV